LGDDFVSVLADVLVLAPLHLPLALALPLQHAPFLCVQVLPPLVLETVVVFEVVGVVWSPLAVCAFDAVTPKANNTVKTKSNFFIG
jgi:hypothetical protein